LAIPLPQDIADEMNKLIYAIAEKSGEDPSKITSKTQIRPEFHVTLGVFHPHMFETNRGLFRQLLRYLHNNKEQYRNLKDMFNGKCIISGIGFYGGNKNNLIECDLVWASVVSNEIHRIRETIHNLLQFAGIDEKHFDFTDPHITLITKKGDIHGIPKHAMIPLNRFLKKDHISFEFNTVNFVKEKGKVVCAFGNSSLNGKPSEKYTKFSKKMSKSLSKDKIYNWGNLFRNPKYKSKAIEIKKLIISKGIKALFRNYSKDDALEIIKLIMK
jgi:2'-5' RNA ligase